MRHQIDHRKLGRTTEHRIAMLRNQAISLFKHDRIQTTLEKAKELRRFAEKLITLAKKDTLHARRIAAQDVHDPDVLKKLFATLGPLYATRPGGYTRIVKLGWRKGDGAADRPRRAGGPRAQDRREAHQGQGQEGRRTEGAPREEPKKKASPKKRPPPPRRAKGPPRPPPRRPKAKAEAAPEEKPEARSPGGDGPCPPSSKPPGTPLRSQSGCGPRRWEDLEGLEPVIGPETPVGEQLAGGHPREHPALGSARKRQDHLRKTRAVSHRKALRGPFGRHGHRSRTCGRSWSARASDWRGDGVPTILFMDEIHRFNKAQQDAFLPYLEEGSVVLIGTTTENPSFHLTPALLSRCRVAVFKPLDEAGILRILGGAAQGGRLAGGPGAPRARGGPGATWPGWPRATPASRSTRWRPSPSISPPSKT